jgi:hypothetical protein
MRKYFITAGLLLALSGAGAVAQTSSTPGVPVPNDPHTTPNPQATAPDQVSPDDTTNSDQDRDHDRTSSDQQQYPDTPRDQDRTSTRDRQNQPDDIDRDQNRNSDRDRDNQTDQNYPHASSREKQHPQASDNDREYEREREQGERHDRMNDNAAYGDQDHDRVSGNGYRDQIQSAMQQSSLNGVSVNDTGSRIELSGTVPTDRDRREALRIAQSYAHGRQVVDNIQVSGNGYGHDRVDQR